MILSGIKHHKNIPAKMSEKCPPGVRPRSVVGPAPTRNVRQTSRPARPVRPSVCPSVRLSSVCLSVRPSVCLSVCLSVRSSVRPSIRPSVRPSAVVADARVRHTTYGRTRGRRARTTYSHTGREPRTSVYRILVAYGQVRPYCLDVWLLGVNIAERFGRLRRRGALAPASQPVFFMPQREATN